MEFQGHVLHSYYSLEDSSNTFQLVYHTLEAFQALKDPIVKEHLTQIGLASMDTKFHFKLDLYWVCQFCANFTVPIGQAHIPNRDGTGTVCITPTMEAIQRIFLFPTLDEKCQ